MMVAQITMSLDTTAIVVCVIGSILGLIGWLTSRQVVGIDKKIAQADSTLSSIDRTLTVVATKQEDHGKRLDRHSSILDEHGRLINSHSTDLSVLRSSMNRDTCGEP